MDFNSYIVQDTKISLSMPLLGFETCHLPQKPKHSRSFKRFAFTLAETLITLTIIGVIAALTVPNLLNKYTKHTYVVGLKKAYSQLQHAVKMIPITEGCSAGDFDCAGMFQGYGKATNIDGMVFGGNMGTKQAYLFSKQFKIKKLCLDTTEPECAFISKIIPNYDSGFVTLDGLEFAYGTGSSFGIDINGEKGPNKSGRDIFYFDIAEEDRYGIPAGTILPSGSKLISDYNGGDGGWDTGYWSLNSCSATNLGRACTGRVLEENAMNY